jgi:phage host-nuclease inhibitor protein Gam
MSIDEVLEENLDFWLRFSTTFQQIQKFETQVQDLQSELLKLEEKKRMEDGSSNAEYSLKSDAKPLYKYLREIHTELTVWLEKSMQLKDEVKGRFTSLCDIQDEITSALKESAEDDEFKFTSYQAAKFQGEILNMKQENNKVADELQAGLDHVTTLQLEVERTLAKLNEEFKLSGSKNRQNIQLSHSVSRSRVPLRSFIFGTKPKKHRTSIFSCMHPALYRRHFRSGPNA